MLHNDEQDEVEVVLQLKNEQDEAEQGQDDMQDEHDQLVHFLVNTVQDEVEVHEELVRMVRVQDDESDELVYLILLVEVQYIMQAVVEVEIMHQVLQQADETEVEVQVEVTRIE